MTVRIIRGQGVDACPQGYWALYDNARFNADGPADILIGDASAPNLKDHGFNDRASSFVNRTAHILSVCDDADYGGRRITVLPGRAERLVVHERTIRPYLFSDEEVGDMNDAVSSVQVHEPGPETARLGAGTYTLVCVASGKALEVAADDPANGVNVQQGEPGDLATQQWRLDPLGDGLYTLTNRATGKRLDVAGDDGAKRGQGANIHQWQALDADSQKWRLRLRPATGHYTLINVFSGKALDVNEGSTAAGANVQQWSDNDTDAQKWRVTPLDAPKVRRIADAWPALRNSGFDDWFHAACPKPGSSEVHLFKDGLCTTYDIAKDVVTRRPGNFAWWGAGYLVKGEAPDAGVTVANSATEVYLFKRENYGRYRTDTSPEAAVGDPAKIEPRWPGLAGTDFTAGVDAAANKPGSATEVYLFRGDSFVAYDAAREVITAGPARIVDGWPGLAGTDFTSGLSAAVAVPGSTTDLFLIKGGSLVRLPPAAPAPAAPARRGPATGTYTLTNVRSSKALDATGDGRVAQWTTHGTVNQRWTLATADGETYLLTSASSGKVLDVSGASRDDGALVQQWTSNGSAAQQWKLTDLGDGVFRLQCVASGKYLDVKGKSLDDGGAIHQWGYDDSDSQKWRLTSAG